MTATTPTYLKLLATHHPTAEVWPEETTLTPRDLFPGVVVSADSKTPHLQWTPIGEYESTPSDIYLAISRAGYSDSSARYVWSTSPETGPIYGWDPLTHIAHVGPVDVYGGSEKRNAILSMCERGDGGLVCVASSDYSDSGTNIRMYLREPVAAWTWAGTVLSDFTEHPQEDYPSGWGASPIVARGEDGATYLAIMVHTPTTADYETNVDIYRAEVDADWSGNPFKPFIRGACRKTHNTLSAVSLGFAIGGGQSLVYIETENQHAQYAGIMPGPLEVVERGGIGYGVTCKFLVGRFHAVYLSATNKVCIKRIGSAFDSLTAAEEIEIDDAEPGTRPAIWADEDGTLYVSSRNAESVRIYESRDGGVTWNDSAQSVVTTAAENTGSTVTSQVMDACQWRGGACMVSSAECQIASVGYAYSVVSLDLGGWSAWPVPATYQYNQSGVREPRIIPIAQWSCLSNPADQDSITLATGGTGSVAASFTTDLRVNIATTGGFTLTFSPYMALSDFDYRTAYLRCAAEPITGPIEHAVLTGTFGLRVVHHDTYVEAFDAGTSSSLGTETVSGLYELFVSVDNLTGDYWVHGRPFVDSDLDARQMTLLLSGSLSASTFTPEVSTTFGNVSSLGRSADLAVWGVYYSGVGSEVAPQMPYGRPISATGTYTTNGVSFAGAGGPALIDEVWICRPDSMWSLDKAALTETYPSLREHFRSADLGTPGAASTPAYLAYKIAGDVADYLAPIITSYVWSNARRVRRDVYYSGAWHTFGSAKDDFIGTGSGIGNTIRAKYTGASSAFHIDRDALVGGWVLVGSDTYKIVGNSAGMMFGVGVANTQTTIRVDGDVATFTDAEIVVVPPHYFNALGLRSTTSEPRIEGFRFKFEGEIPPEGYWTAKVSVGFADVLGLAHGLNTVRSTTPNAITNATRSGIMRREKLGPATRTVEFSWQDIIDPETPQTRTNATTTPDVLTDAFGNAIYVAGSTYGIVRSYVEDCGATGRPVVYWPAYDNFGGSSFSFGSYGGAVVGSISPDTWITEHAEGRDEQRTDYLRGGTIKIVEVT